MSAYPELKLLKYYGDRTNSLVSLYPHFSSFTTHQSGGELRFLEKKSVVAVASEPLAPKECRTQLICDFFSLPRLKNKSKLAFPLSKDLASELEGRGYYSWQIGSEPIFDLKDLFSNPAYVLKNYPSASSLMRRGGKLVEVSGHELDMMMDLIDELKEEWLGKKKLAPIGFLNVVEPKLYKEFKRFFVLKDREKVSAVLTACPVYESDQVVGYFFNDIFKRLDSKNATTELIILESMRVLYHEGIKEVRLGMSPLALIQEGERDSKKLTWIFNKVRLGYNFQNLYYFKNKLKPSRWQNLYLVSDKNDFFRMLLSVLALHMDQGFLVEFFKRNWYSSKRSLALKDSIVDFKVVHSPSSRLGSVLLRIKWTLFLVILFLGLHFLKVSSSLGQSWFDSSGYMISNITWQGVFVAPFFHNHAFHLFGDQLSFFIFGAAIEYTFGSSLFFLMTALGLWVSNPITHALLLTFLKPFAFEQWSRTIGEIDYGSSNAVFALVGSCLYVLKKNGWLLWPFLFYCVYICLQRESFLAIHHFVAIFLGFFSSALFFFVSRSKYKS